MTHARRSVAFVVVLTAFAACTVEDAGPDPIQTWTLTETLRIGTMEDGPAAFSGWINGIDADGQGRVWVFDRDNQEIRVFSPEGAHLMNVGRRGSGPGEFQLAEGLAFAKDGRLWVRDARNSRLSVFSGDGTFESSATMNFCWSQGLWDPVMADPARIVDNDCIVTEERARGYHVVGYRTDLSGIDTIAPVPECGDPALNEASVWVTRRGTSTSYRQIPWSPRAHWFVGAAGETWCVPNGAQFEILRIVQGARDTVRVSAVVADVPVSAAERDSVISDFEREGPTGLDFSRLPTRKPAIDRINVDDEGRLWVKSTVADGSHEFRVFSPEGVAIAVARLSGHRLANHTPFVVRGDAIYTASVDHEEVPIVLRFAISKPGGD